MATYTPNLNLYKPDASDPFGEFREKFNDNMNILDNGGGGGGGGHTIYDENGSAMTQRAGLEFTGSVSVSDDSVNDKTIVDVKGGTSFLLNTIYSETEKRVGYWKDNKPLYQKTIVYDCADNSNVQTAYSIPNTHFIVDVSDAYFQNSTGGLSQQMRYTWYSAHFWSYIVNNSGHVISVHRETNDGNWLSGVKFFITIRYTKTTDTAETPELGNVIYMPTIYSDTERQVGVWRDNKPLYKKTYHFNSTVWINANGWTNGINVDTADVETLVDAEVLRTIGAYSFYGYLQVVPFNNLLNIFNCRNTNMEIDTITLFYTKISDVAGSGDYNTLGVPTEHYSTNEQVVGTYLGKPLYQITYSGLSLVCTNANQSYATNVNWGNIKKIVHSDIIDQYGQSCAGSVVYTGTPAKIAVYMQMANCTVTDITIQYTKTTD